MDYQKDLNYLSNVEAQFRALGEILRQAKKEGKKTITLKDYLKEKEREAEDKLRYQ